MLVTSHFISLLSMLPSQHQTKLNHSLLPGPIKVNGEIPIDFSWARNSLHILLWITLQKHIFCHAKHGCGPDFALGFV